MDTTSISEAIGRHWSETAPTTDSQGRLLKVRWWQHPAIIRHINRNVCGRPIDGFSEGLNIRVLELLKDRLPLEKAISVGCGSGQKEIKLIKSGFVQFFDLYELAETRILAGQELAKRQQVQESVRFVQGNAFDRASQPEFYDLVHWNNSLHHMINVEDAVEWSWQVLKPGGLFYLDDFVGPDRFQWTQTMLLVATAVRQSLPDRLLINPRNPSTLLPRIVKNVDPEKLWQSDPSEAADSSRILECVKCRFPGVKIVLTGGVVYHLALSDVLANFREGDETLMERLLAVDDLCAALGETHYAAALALKS